MENIQLCNYLWYNSIISWYSDVGKPLFHMHKKENNITKGAEMELREDYREGRDGIDSWKEVTLIYTAALRQIETKMAVLNDEFQHVHQYNPIEHIKARIKTPESIVKKRI